MGAKIGSFLATFMLSIPLAAVGLMAVFGVPNIVPAGAGQGQNDNVNRGGRRSLWETIAGDSFNMQQPQQSPATGWDEAPAFNQNAPGQNSPGQNPPVSTPLTARPAVNNDNQFGNSHDQAGNSASNRMALNNAPPAGNFNAAPPRNQGQFGGGEFNGRPTADVRPEQQNGPFGRTPWETAQDDARALPVNNLPANVRTPQLDWQQAQQRLTQLGIENLRVTGGARPGMFLVLCSYAPPESPRVTHRFEAEAEDPLIATNKVLGQIEHWMQTRFNTSNFPPQGQAYSFSRNGPGR